MNLCKNIQILTSPLTQSKLNKIRMIKRISRRSLSQMLQSFGNLKQHARLQTLLVKMLHSVTEPTKKLLMRRYATIQRARDSDVFGILIDCPENSLLILDHKGGSGPSYDPKLYWFLIISPWELEIALSSCIEEYEDDYLSADEAMSKERRSGRRRRRELEGRLVLDFERLLNTWRSEKSLEEVKKGKSSSNETQDGVEKNAPVHSMVTGSYKY
ncbi:hypothetical protein PPACK8108_LOCUS7925 [Phakopsora pachyrhizi]|uniref:Uncharacterized protein n=1 Tax=Phakopsora pachyrhizi TaxID=170000 RepID=A0AAV0AX77_PHAPC|nr:hypothetical protein PPACK8108_LOCUS7925 [Phakopsora pachyrhizi]